MDSLIKTVTLKKQNTQYMMSCDRAATHTHLIIEALDANEAPKLHCVLIYVDVRQLP